MQETNNAHLHYDDDEIDLRELIKNLWEGKLIIGAITVLTLLSATGYAYLSQPVYEATALVMQPLNTDTNELSFSNKPTTLKFKKDQYTPNDIFKIVGTRLSARDNLRRFYEAEKIYLHYEEDIENQNLSEKELLHTKDRAFINDFLNTFKVTLPKRNAQEKIITLTLHWSSPDEAEKLLEKYLESTIYSTRDEILDDISKSLVGKITTLENSIDSKIFAAEQKTLHRIEILDENIKIARKLDIRRIEFLNKDSISRNTLQSAQLKLPLFYLGYEVLEAERNALRERKNHEAFAENDTNTGITIRNTNENGAENTIHALKKELAYLQSVELTPETFKIAQIAQPAIALQSPIKPKKSLVLALGLVLGSMLGIMVVLIRNWFKRAQEN